MNRIQRIISCLLLVCLLSSATGLAIQPEFEVQFEHTKRIVGKLTISSDGIANCHGLLQMRDVSNSCVLYVRLQQKVGNGWKNLYTWPATGSGFVTTEAAGERQVTSGHTYRVYVSANVKNSSGEIIEQPTATSQEVAY